MLNDESNLNPRAASYARASIPDSSPRVRSEGGGGGGGGGGGELIEARCVHPMDHANVCVYAFGYKPVLEELSE